MLSDPPFRQIHATPTEKLVYGAVCGFPLPPVTDFEIESFKNDIRQMPREWKRYYLEPDSFWLAAAQRWKRTEPMRKDQSRLARLSVASTAEAICLTTGLSLPWETIHAVVMLLNEGFSEDRLVEYVQYCHRCLYAADPKDHDLVMARIFSSRIFNHVMPLLRSGKSPDTDGATLAAKIIARLHEMAGDEKRK